MITAAGYYFLVKLVSGGRFFFLINLVRTFRMDGLTRPKSALSGACCADPDPYHPIWKFRVEFRGESSLYPHSRTPSSALTDFYWLRPLPPTTDHPLRTFVNIERWSVSNPAYHYRNPVLYQLSQGADDNIITVDTVWLLQSLSAIYMSFAHRWMPGVFVLGSGLRIDDVLIRSWTIWNNVSPCSIIFNKLDRHKICLRVRCEPQFAWTRQFFPFEIMCLSIRVDWHEYRFE